MPENKATSEAPLWNHFPWMNLSFPLRPELSRAVPITRKRDGGGYELIGLEFATADEAADFAKGLEAAVTQCDRDVRRSWLKRPPPINRDELGNCWGIN